VTALREATEYGYVRTGGPRQRLKEAFEDVDSFGSSCDHHNWIHPSFDAPPSQAVINIGMLDRLVVSDEVDMAKFTRLRNEWKANRGPHSSTEKLVMHPAYQTIIGMGKAAVPFILRELEHETPDSWFWALRAITEANPVSARDRGNGIAMARAWVSWGKDNGYHW
jgi:hypothetical protein